mmetsp:Transcript_32251/g.94310  ORF Transcript_32251/g.94310 Transcript_32251/m.94310 type:complete len:245 (-) Transcript_32251:1031-1765(-)
MAQCASASSSGSPMSPNGSRCCKRYANRPCSKKYMESAATPGSNTTSSMQSASRLTALVHTRPQAAALIRLYFAQKWCLCSVGSQISRDMSMRNCSVSKFRSATSESRISWRCAARFQSTKDMMRIVRPGEMQRRRRYFRNAAVCRLCFQLNCRNCVTDAVMLDKNDDSNKSANKRTHTAKARSGVLHGNTSMEAGVNCVMLQWSEVKYLYETLGSSSKWPCRTQATGCPVAETLKPCHAQAKM